MCTGVDAVDDEMVHPSLMEEAAAGEENLVDNLEKLASALCRGESVLNALMVSFLSLLLSCVSVLLICSDFMMQWRLPTTRSEDCCC